MRRVALPVLALLAGALLAAPAGATPVCTDGYMGGPPSALCGGRIFPEALGSVAYVQHSADPLGFREYQHGVEHLARKYDRWVSTTTLRAKYGPEAVSVGRDGRRPGEPGDTGGEDIRVIKITDHRVPDEGKETLFFSLSIHGNERGGLEGGLRTAEDLAIAATSGGTLADGVDNYTSTTGKKPVFRRHEVRDLLAHQIVYLVDFNPDGWAIGDLWALPPGPFARGNGKGTDLNRQMPSIGRIDKTRNPLQEPEMRAGDRFMREVADQGIGRLMAYGADVHGEVTSQAFMDIMYPGGQFDSVDHRRLMAIAERTKSVVDATLFGGLIDSIEEIDGGNEAEGTFKPLLPTKPAHWATVWDTLGYTDTGFVGDYLATDLGVTGMDYEIFLNHTVPDKVWTVVLQENHINATRAIIKTSMAYARSQEAEFNDANVRVDPVGRAGYVVNPDRVTDRDGAGTKPGPKGDGIGADGRPVEQAPYDVSNQQWFEDTSRLMGSQPFARLTARDVARGGKHIDQVDTLVLADVALPRDPSGKAIDRATYFRQLGAWVRRGGNLVLTDRAVHALGELGIVAPEAVRDIRVYQPYANLRDLGHPMAAGLRPNARQLVEAPILGYEIGNGASPMTVVDTAAWRAAGGKVVGTTGNGAGDADDQARTSIGEVAVGDGLVRIIGGALPTPTEEHDHRFGLRDYALTYTGLFLLENSIRHDVAGLGTPLPAPRSQCRSRRRFEVTLARGTTVRGTQVTVNGRRVRVRRNARGRVVATIDLRGKKAGKATVRIVRRTKTGRRRAEVRRYQTCAAKPKPKTKTKR